MNELLKWELDWIDSNPNQYQSTLHKDSVKQNIIKRYEIINLNNEINRLKNEIRNIKKAEI